MSFATRLQARLKNEVPSEDVEALLRGSGQLEDLRQQLAERREAPRSRVDIGSARAYFWAAQSLAAIARALHDVDEATPHSMPEVSHDQAVELLLRANDLLAVARATMVDPNHQAGVALPIPLGARVQPDGSWPPEHLEGLLRGAEYLDVYARVELEGYRAETGEAGAPATVRKTAQRLTKELEEAQALLEAARAAVLPILNGERADDEAPRRAADRLWRTLNSYVWLGQAIAVPSLLNRGRKKLREREEPPAPPGPSAPPRKDVVRHRKIWTLLATALLGAAVLAIVVVDVYPFAGSSPVALHFDGPSGIAVDARGEIYVVNSSDDSVVSFSPGGRALARWGGEGDNPGTFNAPGGAAVDSAGNVYVADTKNDRIEKFSPGGKLRAVWNPDALYSPEGVTLDGAGNIYVSNVDGDTIVKLSPVGKVLAEWGKEGSGSGQLSYPHGVAVDGRGNVYVADGDNNRIQEFSPAGQPLAIWGTKGQGPGQLDGPSDVAVDRRGDIYVADANNHRIQKLSPSGRPLAQWEISGDGQENPVYLQHLALDSAGDVYVTDFNNSRVLELSPDGSIVAQWT